MEATRHAEGRKREAREGDAHRDVGDPNRVVEQGRAFRDTETGYEINVRGNRVVVRDPRTGKQITQFKNTRANTAKRIETGRWVPIEE
jgi:hypothetical protein